MLSGFNRKRGKIMVRIFAAMLVFGTAAATPAAADVVGSSAREAVKEIFCEGRYPLTRNFACEFFFKNPLARYRIVLLYYAPVRPKRRTPIFESRA